MQLECQDKLKPHHRSYITDSKKIKTPSQIYITGPIMECQMQLECQDKLKPHHRSYITDSKKIKTPLQVLLGAYLRLI